MRHHLVILKRVHGVDPVPVDFDAREWIKHGDSEHWPETVLLIGDKVVSASPPSVNYPYQIDLGQAWLELTRLPFVYAIWMCRAEDAARPEILDASDLLERQRLRNQMRIDWIVSSRASERNWPDDLAREYLGHRLRFDCGPREREGISRFLELAAADGLAPRVEPRYVDLDASVPTAV